MCMLCGGVDAAAQPLGRRGLLTGLGAIGLTMGVSACGSASPSAARQPAPATPTEPGRAKLELVLLGTQAGPPTVADRAGIATALIVDGHIYLIDCGRAAVTQFVRAGLSFERIRSIFLTHLHVDHIADYFNFFVLSGLRGNTMIAPTAPVAVYGPGPAGGLPPKFGGGDAPVVAATDPTPGTRALTENWNRALAYSSNVFIRDSGGRDPMTLMDVHEIEIPSVGANLTNRAPMMQPFEVMRDDTVRVTATLVPHGPVFPAFAFRFDTAHGSVTFSGDTTYTDNLITLARETDLLVHEAVNLEGANLPAALHNHMIESHVEVQQTGAIAQRSGAKRLVLSHLVEFAQPPLDPKKWHGWAKTGYDGDVIIGSDLQRIVLA